jgi:lipopolysaccharide transport system permease protein
MLPSSEPGFGTEQTQRLPRLRAVDIVHAPDPAPARRGWEMAAELWQARELLWQLTLRDVRVRYRQAILGATWALLMPALIVLAGVIVKSAIAHAGGAALDARGLAAVVLKALPWGLFVGAVGFATTSLTNNLHLVTRIYFPREVLPLSCLLTQLADTLLACAVAAVLIVALGAATLAATLLWVLPLTLLALSLTAGACLFLSCANLFYRDVRYLVQIMLTFGIFFTPVFFEAEQLGPIGCPLLMLNPLAPLVEGLRLAVLEQHHLVHVRHTLTAQGDLVVAWHPAYLALAFCWAVPGSLAAWALFHRLESVFAEHI